MPEKQLSQLAEEQYGDYDNSRLLDIHFSIRHPEMKSAYEQVMSDIGPEGEKLKGKTKSAMAGYTKLILNNCIARAFQGVYVVVSRKVTAFAPDTRYAKLGIRRVPFLLALDRMVKHGWLEMTLGHPSKYYDFKDKDGRKVKGQLTRIRPTPKLLNLFPTLSLLDVENDDNRQVVLKDREGLEVKFLPQECPTGVVEKLTRINDVFSIHKIDFQLIPQEYKLNPHYHKNLTQLESQDTYTYSVFVNAQ